MKSTKDVIKDLGGQLKFMVLRDAPLSLIPLWGGAAALWVCYLKARPPAPSM